MTFDNQSASSGALCTTMSSGIECPYCRKTLKNASGLTQHIQRTKICREAQLREVVAPRSVARLLDQGTHGVKENACPPIVRRSTRVRDRQLHPTNSHGYGVLPDAPTPVPQAPHPDPHPNDSDRLVDPNQPEDSGTESECSGTDSGGDTSDSGAIAPNNYNEATDEEDSDKEPCAHSLPNTLMLEEFREYCNNYSDAFIPFTRAQKTSIRLLATLKMKKAPLNTFAEVLEWHLKETNELAPHETLKDSHRFTHRKPLMKHLFKRYNLGPMVPKLKTLTLPHSGAVVTIPYRDAKDCIVSLLTDPRVKDKHYLFRNQNPVAPPPDQVVYLADLDTGEAYLQSYKKYITKPNQAILMIKFYIDGANTGQFSDLPVTALKMALGIHSQDCRFHEWAWRTLAWIPQVRKHEAKGKKLYKESQHMDSQDIDLMEGEGEEAFSEGSDTDGEAAAPDQVVKAQDFHTMLSFALKSFVKLQETGFIWDVVAYGKTFKGVEFIPIVVNINCDSEEGDLLCGKYTVRNSNIKHVCRYCHCPTNQADNFNAKYPMKTQKAIQRLVERQDLEGLQAISQQNIQNAWYKVRFHAANDRGVHGACPSEMLHAILLGIFKYTRDIFFEYMGSTSQLASEMDGLCQQYGEFFTHQSDRDLPHTHFGRGIRKGKLMAKQYRGVLLVIAAVLRSTMGRQRLKRKRQFGKEKGLQDWRLLVELLLEWEAFLCEKKMKRADVVRLKEKHRFIMYIMRNVAKRSKGMGLKIMKFHAILHLVEDTLLYGVPSEVDTGGSESHHKTSKVAAKLTQRNEATFDYQTGVRMTEFLAIDLAEMEVNDEKTVSEYFDLGAKVIDLILSAQIEDLPSASSNVALGSIESLPESGGSDNELGGSGSESEEEPLRIETGGTQIVIFEDESDNNEPSFEIRGKSKHKAATVWNAEVVVWLNELQNLLSEEVNAQPLKLLTEHRRGDILFRGHPNHRGRGPWRDWALFNWGASYGVLPGQIWCFVVLEGLPSGRSAIEFGGVRIENGVYAVTEMATYDDPNALEENLQSDLFVPLKKDVMGIDPEGNITGRKFYLADVNSIEGPCAVVPDIGGASNGFLQVKARNMWVKEFIHWLRSSHQDDQMIVSDVEDTDSEDEPPKKRRRL